MEFHTLRPGLLVSMFTSVKGNVSYHDIDRDVVRMDRTEVTDIHTRKQVNDVDEQEAAIKQRTKIRGLILKHCVATAFSNSLICPNNKEEDLREAVEEARRLADEFNATARTTRISFYVITGRIAQDDVETVRAIASEVRQLVDGMQAGVKALDPKMIRDNANKLTQVGKVLSPEATPRLQAAIKASRQVADKMSQVGQAAAKEVDRQALTRLKMARVQFLDIENSGGVEYVRPKNGRNIDLAG
jgi:hypothetical protein